MKKSLLLLLLVAFITLLTSCSKQELKEITITEASAMLQEAKDNTTSVDAYSFEMPLKVTYIDKATVNDELKKEEKYDIKGTIKATVNNKKKEAHIKFNFNYTFSDSRLGATTTASVLVDIYQNEEYIYTNARTNYGGEKTIIKNKAKSKQGGTDMLSEYLALYNTITFNELLIETSDFQMYKIGNKHEFVYNSNLGENKEPNRFDFLIQQLGDYDFTEDSTAKLIIIFGDSVESFNYHAIAKGNRNYGDTRWTNVEDFDLDLALSVNLKANPKTIDFTKFEDYVEIDSFSLVPILGGFGRIFPVGLPFF